jgi:hypothetical protein
MSTSYLKPSTKGMRAPLENGSVGDMISNPPRWAQIGGLKSAAKIGKRNTMSVKRPGQSEHK